ncbi:hypothetical protein [Pseudomonas piscis]|uniref:hypothetical protein n=1 Tax=Pseudomonas piscis TaxID=2614538 RepID=UPI001F17C37E|nr:hypothetical protein [Pseudomonas piscis]
MGTRVAHRNTPGWPVEHVVARPPSSRGSLSCLVHGVALGLSLTQAASALAATTEQEQDQPLILDTSVISANAIDSPTGQQSGYVPSAVSAGPRPTPRSVKSPRRSPWSPATRWTP